MPTIASTVTNRRSEDTEYIVQQRSALTGKSGYISLVFNSLLYNVQDIQSVDLPLNYSPTVVAPEDGFVPLLGLQNAPAPTGYNLPILAYPCSKVSGLRTLSRKLMVFAVNNGKLDANANMASTAEAQLAALTVAKVPQLPCNDNVTVTLDYTATVSVA